MNLDYHFNINRFGNLMRREVYTNMKLFLISLGAVSGIIFVIFTFALIVNSNEHYSAHSMEFFSPFFIISFLILGLVLTSLAYRDFLHPHKRYAYLTLPVSNLERLLSMLLMTTVVYTLGFILYFYAFSFLMNFYGMLFPNFVYETFDLSKTEIVKSIKVYLVIQSIFLMGAATFKKYPLLLTILVGYGAQFVLSLILVLAALIIFNDYVGQSWEVRIGNNGISEDFKAFVENDVVGLLKFVFWYLLAPFFWVVTFLKIKEKEA